MSYLCSPFCFVYVFIFSSLYRIRYDFDCQEIVKGRTNYETWWHIVDSTQKFYGQWKTIHGENEKS